MKIESLILTIFLFLVPASLVAQSEFHISLFPGYHVINSDKPAVGDNASKTNWIFGGKISSPFQLKGYPIELSIGYSEGNSTTYTYVSTSERFDPPRFDINLRYRTLPIEVYRKFNFDNRFDVFAGLNLTFQHRVLQYDERFSIGNDRLFSIGFGLSGKIQTTLFTFKSGNGAIFGNLAARWTEFIFHDANGRDVDDYTLRHVAISPQIGIAWGLK